MGYRFKCVCWSTAPKKKSTLQTQTKYKVLTIYPAKQLAFAAPVVSRSRGVSDDGVVNVLCSSGVGDSVEIEVEVNLEIDAVRLGTWCR